MENKKASVWLWILILAVVVIAAGILIYFSIRNPAAPANNGGNNTNNNSNNGDLECSNDNDCMPDSCCHPTSCVKKEDRVCNQACTKNCQGPIDCGEGECGCVSGKCQVIDLTPAQNTTENPQTYNVDISGYAYSPSTLTIKKGDTVRWTNMDSVRHTVTSDSGSELDSALLSDGQIYSHTFNTAGTFNYHCKPHPYMKAKVIVE